MTEIHFAAARALLAEQKAATGNPQWEARVARKLRRLAAKTPLSHERTVLALDIAATRLGCGEGRKKGLQFLQRD